VAERLAAPQEGLISVELVSYLVNQKNTPVTSERFYDVIISRHFTKPQGTMRAFLTEMAVLYRFLFNIPVSALPGYLATEVYLKTEFKYLCPASPLHSYTKIRIQRRLFMFLVISM
jgi:hypothetical protein